MGKFLESAACSVGCPWAAASDLLRAVYLKSWADVLTEIELSCWQMLHSRGLDLLMVTKLCVVKNVLEV